MYGRYISQISTIDQLNDVVDKWIEDRKAIVSAQQLVDSRVNAIADYFNQYRITGAVVAISGGVDSAVVLGLLDYANKSGKLKQKINIIGVNIVYDQYRDLYQGHYVDLLINKFTDCKFLKYDLSEVDHLLSKITANDALLTDQVRANVNYQLRYNVLFSIAQQYKAITVGTINRSELNYVGWFGKNSDLVVDIQLLTCLDKFQVYQVAEVVAVPDQIIARQPVGDLITNESDYQAFGNVTYNQLTWYTNYISSNRLTNKFIIDHFSEVERLRKINIHKYHNDDPMIRVEI